MTRLFYLRNEKRFPVACIATHKNADGSIRYAISVWNPLDTFSKASGRTLAERRCYNGPWFTVPAGVQNVKVHIVTELALSAQTSKRARKMAREWLAKRLEEHERRLEEKGQAKSHAA